MVPTTNRTLLQLTGLCLVIMITSAVRSSTNVCEREESFHGPLGTLGPSAEFGLPCNCNSSAKQLLFSTDLTVAVHL